MFGEFVTKSGRRSPYFVNTGNYSTGEEIAKLGEYYAECIVNNMHAGDISAEVVALFGPAYKGIPLAVSAAAALSRKQVSVNYCFNRKEAKDHGEKGDIVGYRPKDGDRILIIEDVLTAGTALRECVPLLKASAEVRVEGLVISVDRMERGLKGKTASKELLDEFGIRTFPIVTVRDVLETLYNSPLDGVVHVNDEIKERMLAYFGEYCEIDI
jgi:orotate phosphoribosyltransferase